jgi:hypothetical protein
MPPAYVNLTGILLELSGICIIIFYSRYSKEETHYKIEDLAFIYMKKSIIKDEEQRITIWSVAYIVLVIIAMFVSYRSFYNHYSILFYTGLAGYKQALVWIVHTFPYMSNLIKSVVLIISWLIISNLHATAVLISLQVLLLDNGESDTSHRTTYYTHVGGLMVISGFVLQFTTVLD